MRTQYYPSRPADQPNATYNGQRFIRNGKPQSVGNFSSGRRVAGARGRSRAIGTAVDNSRQGANSFACESAEYNSMQDGGVHGGVYSNMQEHLPIGGPEHL